VFVSCQTRGNYIGQPLPTPFNNRVKTNVVNSIPNQPVWLEKYHHKTCIFNPLEMCRFRYWGVSARFDNFRKFRCVCSWYNHFGQDRYKLKWDFFFFLVCTNCFAPRQIVGQRCLKLQLAGPSTTSSCFQLAEPIVTTESFFFFFFCSLVCSASSVFVFYA
jgi:hypothetical protein